MSDPNIYDDSAINAASGGITRQMLEEASRSPLFGQGRIVAQKPVLVPANYPLVYEETMPDGIVQQHIIDAANNPQFNIGPLVSTPGLPNPYWELWEAAKIGSFAEPYRAQAPMSQRGAIRHDEVPFDLGNGVSWSSHMVICPKCGGPCQYVELSLREEDSDVVFRCIPCYEKHHAKKSVPIRPTNLSELRSDYAEDLPAQAEVRSQSRAWDAAPWIDALPHAGTYSPTD